MDFYAQIGVYVTFTQLGDLIMSLEKQLYIKIADIIPNEYQDFLSYCTIAGKVFTSDITAVDYVAYRSQFGREKSDVRKLREMIAAGGVLDKNDDVERSADSSALKHLISDESSVKSDGQTLVTTQEDERGRQEEVESGDDCTYAELLGLNADDFSALTIPQGVYDSYSISFGTRLLNALQNNGCLTLKDVLLLTPQGFRKMWNVGAKSIKELEDALVHIADCGAVPNSPNESTSIRRNVVQEVVLNILKSENYSISGLNKSEIAFIEKAIQAKEDLGEDLCTEFLNETKTQNLINLIDALHAFCVESTARENAIQSAREAVSGWDDSIQLKALQPFMKLYCVIRMNQLSEEFKTLAAHSVTVGQYAELIQSQLCGVVHDIWTFTKELKEFQEWMNGINIDELCKRAFSLTDATRKRRLNERHFEMLYARAMGRTLEDIAQQNELTRERVRQIVSKVANVIIQGISGKYNLLAIISAYRGGDQILQKAEVLETIGAEYGQILWFCATQTKPRPRKKDKNDPAVSHVSYWLDSDLCHYDREHDTIIVTINQFNYSESKARVDVANQKAHDFVAQLPDLIETSDLQQRLEEGASEQALPLELLTIIAEEVYCQAGAYAYRDRLTVVQMCDRVLKVRFPNGYKISADSELAVRYLEELFGYSGRTTPRAVDSKIMELGVLVDRGKYVHPDYIDVDQGIVENVFAFIANSPKSALTYAELYEEFQDRFAGTIVSNRFALQGVMKLYGCPFSSHRDYVSKECGADVADEFNDFMESVGTATKAEILANFPGWKDHNIAFVLPRCPEVLSLDGGIYMHAGLLEIREEDRVSIKKYLDANIFEIPVSTRFLQDELMNLFPEFMIRNDIQRHSKLFAVLQYMFPKEFHFSKPYISKEHVGKITNKAVLLQHIGEMDAIDIDDLVDLARQNAVHFTGITAMLEKLQPELIRIDRTTLMRYESVGLSEEIYEDIVSTLNEAIAANGGCLAAAAINDFTWYPSLNVPWTPYLLEAVANLLGDEVCVIKMITTDNNIPHAIFVSDAYKDEDWNSLVLRLIKEEHAREPFTTKTEVLEWLQSKSVCNTKYPTFLDTENHLYFDEDGKLMVE